MLPPDSVLSSRRPSAILRVRAPRGRASTSRSSARQSYPSARLGTSRREQRHVLGDGQPLHDVGGQRILRHPRRAGVERLGGPAVGHLAPEHLRGCPAARSAGARATSASSRWPLPETPATPTTSPRSIVRLTPCRARLPALGLDVDLDRLERRGRVDRAAARGRGRICGRCRPTTASTSLASVSVAGSTPSTCTTPPRRTVRRSHMARTRELVRDHQRARGPVAELAHDGRRARPPPAARARSSARRGSSSARRSASTLRISTCWRSPDREVADARALAHLEPVALGGLTDQLGGGPARAGGTRARAAPAPRSRAR